jgi:hypothetical protein
MIFSVDLFILANKLKKQCLFFQSQSLTEPLVTSRGTLGFRGTSFEKPWPRGWTTDPLVAAIQRHCLTLSTWTTYCKFFFYICILASLGSFWYHTQSDLCRIWLVSNINISRSKYVYVQYPFMWLWSCSPTLHILNKKCITAYKR